MRSVKQLNSSVYTSFISTNPEFFFKQMRVCFDYTYACRRNIAQYQLAYPRNLIRKYIVASFEVKGVVVLRTVKTRFSIPIFACLDL